MALKIAVLPGDGIGPEVIRHAVRVLATVVDSARRDIRIEEHAIGATAIRTFGMPLPPSTLAACLDADAVLLGAVGDPSFDRTPAAERPEAGLLQLRRALGRRARLGHTVSPREGPRRRHSDRSGAAGRSLLRRAARLAGG